MYICVLIDGQEISYPYLYSRDQIAGFNSDQVQQEFNQDTTNVALVCDFTTNKVLLLFKVRKGFVKKKERNLQVPGSVIVLYTQTEHLRAITLQGTHQRF